jgi:hypothetical protein
MLKGQVVVDSLLAFLAALRVYFRSRSDIALEILALRQQVAVLKRKRPRPVLNRVDRLFWTSLRRYWPRWAEVLVIVRPETVIGWHRAGFRLYWRWCSRPRSGRPKITDEIRVLIRRLAQENSNWGAPKIHGELLKLGFRISERSVARYLRRVRHRGDPAKRWRAFLHNHREVIVAFVGSRTGAVLRRSDLSVAPCFLWECLTSRTVSLFPAPATSHPACGFPALGAPVCFAARFMRPIVLERLSAMASPTVPGSH